MTARHRMSSVSPPSCSWHLATYLLGWLMAALGVGLMVLSSDPVTTNGNWLVVLVAGIACAALGGCLIVIAVAIPDGKGAWCRSRKLTKNRNDICEKHEGQYIRFPCSQANGNGQETLFKAVLPPENIMSSPIRGDSYYGSNLVISKHGSISNFGSTLSWSSNKCGALLGNDSRCYSDTDENLAIMFYRETPV